MCHLAGLVSEEMRALTEVRGEEEHVLVDLINSTAHLVNTGKVRGQLAEWDWKVRGQLAEWDWKVRGQLAEWDWKGMLWD